MKNMKQILRAFTALGLTTVAGTSVTACFGSESKQKLPENVLTNLGLIDGEKKSTVVLETKLNGTHVSFHSAELEGKNASALLNSTTNKAKDKESYDLLISLGLKPTDDKKTTLEEATFTKADAEALKLTVVKYSPKFTENKDKNDYYLNGGTATVQWKNSVISNGNIYQVDLKPGTETDTFIKTAGANYKLADEDINIEGALASFKIDTKNEITKDLDVTKNLKNSDKAYQLVNFAKLLNDNGIADKLSATVKEFSIANQSTWADNDTLTIALKIGKIDLQDIKLTITAA